MNGDTDERPPWERQPDETARAYNAFCEYRDLGPHRRLHAASDRFYARDPRHHTDGQPPSDFVATPGEHRQFQEWSRLNAWRDRVEAWDAHLDEIARVAKITATEKMYDEFAVTAAGLRTVTARLVTHLLQLTPEELAERVNMTQLARLLDTAWKVESAARQVPSSIQRHEHDVEVEVYRESALELLDDARLRLVQGGAG